MPKYSKKTQKTVATAMRKYKKGKLKSGKSKKKVTSRKQAIAIGLSEARTEGAKVPEAPTKKRTVKKVTRKKSTAKSTTQRVRTKKQTSSRKKSNK